ncbi:apolipoprotein N-acyltransferase [Helicobacter sp. MIT 99-5507]|nr:apolipoprotein N-acyltransferase [Helicobacter sp. MIT 99-5507]
MTKIMFNIRKFFTRDNKPKINIFNAENKIRYIIKNWLFIPFILAFIFSLPLYANFYTYLNEEYFPYINAILVLISLFTYLNINKRFAFSFGFFIGLFWFYWIGLSFRYTNSAYLVYVIPIIVGIIYAILIWLALFFNNIIFRAITLSLIGYVTIFGFDWFIPDAMLSFSIFKVDKISFIIIVATLSIISIKQIKLLRFLAIFLLFFAIDFDIKKIRIPNEKILLTQTNIQQKEKWAGNNLDKIVQYNISLIENAINDGYSIVVLPETAFPIILNTSIYENIVDELKELSTKITIIVGAQRYDGFGVYNTTYVFNNKHYQFADKIFLAPFGEYMPIPGFIADFFSKIFNIRYSTFDTQDKEPINIFAGNLIFRNAICYEATTKKAYKDNPKYMMLISNNIWFKPSNEPILQMMLIKYYSRLHKTIVFHSANGSKSGIITPNMNLDFRVNGI